MKDIGINIEVEEDKETFRENAIKKAMEISKALNGKWCIADDSGIEIECLNGFPGVKTKRWLNGTDRQRNLAIIDKLKNIPKENRKIMLHIIKKEINMSNELLSKIELTCKMKKVKPEIINGTLRIVEHTI